MKNSVCCWGFLGKTPAWALVCASCYPYRELQVKAQLLKSREFSVYVCVLYILQDQELSPRSCICQATAPPAELHYQPLEQMFIDSKN